MEGSRECPLANETIVDDFPSFGSGDFDLYLKAELLTNCYNQDITNQAQEHYISQQESGGMQFCMNMPDSTQLTLQSFVPCPTSRLPSKENYPGPYEFDIDVTKTCTDKSKWEYSDVLSKIFVTMGRKVPLIFKWKHQEYGLFVRALPIFLAQDAFEEPVRRCASHISSFEESNKGFKFVDHIIRCEDSRTTYEKNSESNRLSVKVPLDPPQPGCDGTTVVYTFMCKNSCTVGMNRRTTGIIFTLEHENGEVMGRKLLNIRICSCPRRDMTKEEGDHLNKNLTQTNIDAPPTPAPKKRPKRLSKGSENFQIRLPKTYIPKVARIIKDMITIDPERNLSADDVIAIEDCDKYL